MSEEFRIDDDDDDAATSSSAVESQSQSAKRRKIEGFDIPLTLDLGMGMYDNQSWNDT